VKVLVIVEKESTKDILAHHLLPRGFDVIWYTNPIKGMDNIDEIDPDLVLFSAEDFPRHWKPFVNLLREHKGKDETVFVLLKGEIFPFEEAAKASFLGVNGIVKENFSDRQEMLRLEELFGRYNPVSDGRSGRRYMPNEWDDIDFLFTHPVSMKLVSGMIADISTVGLSFIPDDPQLTSGIKDNTRIPYCSLEIGDSILTIACRVVRNNQIIRLQFLDADEELRQFIADYIDESTERKLNALLSSS
jgi:hypothetical protein